MKNLDELYNIQYEPCIILKAKKPLGREVFWTFYAPYKLPEDEKVIYVWSESDTKSGHNPTTIYKATCLTSCGRVIDMFSNSYTSGLFYGENYWMLGRFGDIPCIMNNYSSDPKSIKQLDCLSIKIPELFIDIYEAIHKRSSEDIENITNKYIKTLLSQENAEENLEIIHCKTVMSMKNKIDELNKELIDQKLHYETNLETVNEKLKKTIDNNNLLEKSLKKANENINNMKNEINTINKLKEDLVKTKNNLKNVEDELNELKIYIKIQNKIKNM